MKIRNDWLNKEDKWWKQKLPLSDILVRRLLVSFIPILKRTLSEYKKEITVSSAIENSGGFQDYADKRKVYVIKANGTIEKTRRNVFSGNVRLEPGDTVVVPRKIQLDNPLLEGVIPLTTILSDLAFSAAALDNLSNSN